MGCVKMGEMMDKTWMDEMARRAEAAENASTNREEEEIILPDPMDIANGKGGLDENKFAKWLIASDQHHFVSMEDTHEILYYKNGVYRLGGERVIDGLLIRTMDGAKCTISKGREAIHLVGGRVGIERDVMDGDENLINLRNGVYDLREGVFLQHSPDMLMMKQMNIIYDASATCPKFDKFIHEVVSDEEAEFVYELFGYMLLPRKTMETAVFLEGVGSNGKSVLMDVMKHFIGKESFSEVVPTSLNGNNEYAIADIYGKSLNVVDDLGDDVIEGVGAFKSIISGKSLRGRQIYRSAFSFVPNTLCVFGCNKVPQTTDTSPGYFRRMRIVKFVNVFEGESKNRTLIDELRECGEMSGIFNRGIEAIKRVIIRGDFTGAKTVSDMKAVYMASANPILQFINAAYEITLGTERIEKDDLYNVYAVWCKGMGIDAEGMSELTITLKGMGVRVTQPTIGEERVRCYAGIRQKSGCTTHAQGMHNPNFQSTVVDNAYMHNPTPPCCKESRNKGNNGNMEGVGCAKTPQSTMGGEIGGCAYPVHTPGHQQSKRIDFDQSTIDRIRKATSEAIEKSNSLDGCDVDQITFATRGLARSTVAKCVLLNPGGAWEEGAKEGLYRLRV